MFADAIRDGKIQQIDDNDVDIELVSPSQLLSTHVNSMPFHGAVQAPRLFYGARFFNQAVPLVNREAALVQNIDSETGESFEDLLGGAVGAIRAKKGGQVLDVQEDYVEYQDDDGETQRVDLYNNFPFNRLTGITQKSLFKPGDRFEAGAPIVGSNFTDDKGQMSMGVNARIGLLPYKGYSMDDAVVISSSMAKRMTSEQMYTDELELSEGKKAGKGHFTSLFPSEYTKDQLNKLNKDGVPEVGTILEEGDPYMLTTKPKLMSSNQAALGKLSRAMQNTRENDSFIWHHKEPGLVTDVAKTKKGWKVAIKTEAPAKVGDKAVLRHGQKGIISKILEDDKMPRTEDGQPLEVMINPMGIPSRVANAIVYDLILGKIAKKKGKPYRLPAFNGKDENWYDFVERELADNEMTDKERLYDPEEDRYLENPVLVGYGNYLKLHHMAEKKLSGRSQGSYDDSEQPLKGGSEAAQAKRLGTLELGALMSHGAYATMREGSTLRGAKNDAYWRALRQGQAPAEPGTPFAWNKFKALLVGSGYLSRQLPGGKERLGPFTDKRLNELKPSEINKGDIVDLNTLDPVKGGLFDPSLVGADKWGTIRLPEPLPNPAFEKQIALLLGVKQKDIGRILGGETTLEELLNTK